MSIASVKKQVLSSIKPRKTGTKLVNDVVAKINQALKVNNVKAKCVIGGSFAKDTFLKNDHDVDLFVRFDYKKYLEIDKKGGLSEILEGILLDAFKKIERVHGSRDYFSLKKDKFDIEIVPVLEINNPKKAMNVTDMSPLHVDWVKKHKKGNEIRLSKAFCKAAKCYGAESYIKGFSGHVLDILTIYYGSFEKLLRNCVEWGNEKVIVDFYNVYKGKAMKKLNKSKTHSPLIVIDPVLSERNAAAALSREKFNLFVERAKKFLAKPSKGLFVKKNLGKNSISAKDKLVFLKAKAVKGKEDVVGAKLLKVFTHIKKHLKINGFILKKSDWEFNKKRRTAVMYFVVDKKTLPATMIKQGPPIKKKKHCAQFIEKHETTFRKAGRIFAQIKRPYRTVSPLINKLIKEDYIKEKVKSIKVE